MFDLFEFKRLLSVCVKPKGDGKISQSSSSKSDNGSFAVLEDVDHFLHETDVQDGLQPSSSPSIQCHAFTGPCRHPVVALSLTNGNVLFYALKTPTSDRPSVRQLPWFVHRSKQIVALTFDPSGCWLLVSTRDATLFILPTFAFFNGPVPSDPPWSTEDLTEIRLSGRMAVPTAILWWRTSRAQSIAITGNELGEISFIDLELRKEVGGTYITVSIANMELITDDANGRVYLLITGSNQVQWQLILEQSDVSYQFPLEGLKIEKLVSPQGPSSSRSILSCLPTAVERLPRSSSNLSKGSGDFSFHPIRLAQFTGNTVLRSAEKFRGKKYVLGFCSSADVLTLHHADLNQVPSYVFRLPPGTHYAVLGDHLIFVITYNDTGMTMRVISADLTLSLMGEQRSYDSNCELQTFSLANCGKILQMIRCRIAFVGYTSRFGCLLITKRGLYCLRQKVSSENLFLRLVLHEGCFTKAERAAKLLGMDVGVLYEKAAEAKLVDGHVGPAVRFFQMAKCPHIRSVANFAAYGHLSEVLSYVRVLFAKPTFDLSQIDLKHFSNLALYCYVQQCLEQSNEGVDITRRHFRDFLLENPHYDEIVAVHLLATYGFYELLMELAEWRGLIPQALHELLPPLPYRDAHSLPPNENGTDENRQHLRPLWTNAAMSSCLAERGFGDLVSLENHTSFVACLLRPCLPSFFGLNIKIAWRHLTIVKRLVDDWTNDVDRLKSLINIYNPSNPAYAPLFHFSLNNRDSSCRSSNFLEDIGVDISKVDIASLDRNVVDLAKELTAFFLKLLLILNNKCRNGLVTFDQDLVGNWRDSHIDDSMTSLKEAKREQIVISTPPSCLVAGFSHACVVIDDKLYSWGRNYNGCLGRGPARREWLMAECVPSLKPPLLRVSSVACGSSHTLILTDNGIYACGSNRYGQLGVNDVDLVCNQTCHPLLVKSLPCDVHVAAIACGQHHSLALSSDGVVYSWGWGVHGQLAHGHPHNVRTPRVVESLISESSHIVSVSAGYAHSVFLSATGEVFVCGCGQFGQLGTPRTSKSSLPVRLQLPEAVRLVAAGYVHNVAVTVSGKIFTWGCNPQTLRLRAQVARRNRASTSRSSSNHVSDVSSVKKPPDASELYDPESIPGIFTPAQIESEALDSEVVQLSCGSNHTVLVTRDGRVYSWGRNLDGQSGHDDRRERAVPTEIVSLNNRKAVLAACGGDFTLVLDDLSEVSGFGVDDFGQIGGAVDSNSSFLETSPANSPGKVHTFRTSKRVVFLKQPTRCSILQPIILSLLPSASSSKFYSDGTSCERPISSPWCKLFDDAHCTNFPDSMVHLALEQFHELCDGLVTEELCLSVGNFQAAAKVAHLDGNMSQSFSSNLRAVSAAGGDATSIEQCSKCLSLLTFYLETIVQNDTGALKSILKAVIGFWASNSGPVRQLEDYLTIHLAKLLFPIAAIIYGDPESKGNVSEGTDYFVNQFSSQFSFRVVSEIMEAIKRGSIDPEVTDLLAESVNKTLLNRLQFPSGEEGDGARPTTTTTTKRLWDELIQNLWSNTSGDVTSAIDLSSVQVLNFLRDVGSGSTEIVLFTCGHHYPKEEFRTTVLPHLEEALNESSVSPENSRTVVATYETMGFQSTACPRCLLDGLQQEAS